MPARVRGHGSHQDRRRTPVLASVEQILIDERVCLLTQIYSVTARKAAEEEHQTREERFRAFDHAAMGMALVAIDGRFLQVNNCLCTILASSEAELLGKSFVEITLAEDRNVDGHLVQQLLHEEIASYQVEKRLVRTPDEVIWGRLPFRWCAAPRVSRSIL